MLNYNGYIGQIEFDDETDLFHGEVINTKAVITFQGTTVPEIKAAFRDSIEDYLEFCTELGEEPEKPNSGELVLKLPLEDLILLQKLEDMFDYQEAIESLDEPGENISLAKLKKDVYHQIQI